MRHWKPPRSPPKSPRNGGTDFLLAFDYGKTWIELAEATPAGTARAYFRHAQSNDLLARPGEQDLTCHVCWDWLADALARHGFAAPQVESQESFFVHHAADFLATATTAEAGRFSEKTQPAATSAPLPPRAKVPDAARVAKLGRFFRGLMFDTETNNLENGCQQAGKA